ncbi:MAG: SCO1664 family protein [Anaerolineae bacterium]
MNTPQPTQDEDARRESVGVTIEQVLETLESGKIEEQGMLPWSSNYTFLVTVSAGDLALPAVYKPRRGERPLWDFPQGTLCLRERAAYLVSAALGWLIVPPTVLRSGPRGFGSLQFYVDCDQEEHYFTFRDTCQPEAQRIALFDIVVNNADRKAGHMLRGYDGRIWAIDHGIAFHTDPKLRTVIWDFAGQPVPDDLLDDLERLQAMLKPSAPLREELGQLLSNAEMNALERRLKRLLADRFFPDPGPGRHIPWPPV